MARYEGRHRATRATAAPPVPQPVPLVPVTPGPSVRTTAGPQAVLSRVVPDQAFGSSVGGRHGAPVAGRHGAPVAGRHEAPAAGRHVAPPSAAAYYGQVSSRARAGGGAGRTASGPTLPSRRALKAGSNPPRRPGRPVLVGALALGLGASAVGFATADLRTSEAAFVVGDNVVAQTEELARTSTVDLTYRAAASVSRNERRTAIVATGLRSAAALEAKQKAEAARRAEERRLASEAAERERMREQVIANARTNPQAAARILLADEGFTSDAQFNCLVNLWNGESGWRWNAENSSSGAYGIPQSLPASKMATFGADYRTNPITQMKWGIWYIEQAYGSPCNAWSTWLSRSPHWY